MKRPLIILALLLSSSGALAEDPAGTPPAPVTREEYERLLRDQAQMRQELDQLKAHGPATTAPENQAAAPASQPVTQEDLQDIQNQIDKMNSRFHSALPGTEHLVIAGDAAVGFINQQKTNSTFFAGVAPLFLWQPTDRLLFEAAMDIGVSTDPSAGSSTSFDLTIADASFIVNDYLVVGGGLFVVPFGQYHNHFDPPWINKLPDDPLAFGDGGIAPGSEVGIFARGAAPVLTNSKVVYDIYLTNGPQLITNDPAAAGSLNFDDFTDLNNGKAVGGRIGFLPIPDIETGYSFQYSQTSPSGFHHHAYAFLQAFDLNVRRDVHSVGMFRLHTEWVWSSVGRETFGGGSSGFAPISFSNYRTGGYVELAFRPTYSPNKIVQNLEGVVRYNLLRTPLNAPGGDHEQLWEFGIDYWVSPSAVLKVAYEVDDKKIGPDQHIFAVQFGIGL